LAAASVDDIGAATGRATAKAAGVVIDDTAVTPQYVQGITADRELPMIRRIAVGSLRNKLLLILPAALLLSQFAPRLLTPILMLGATYLCYEGAEKVWARIRGHEAHAAPSASGGEDTEKQMTSSAIRTDFILSAEIMVIALNEVADQSFWPRLVILIVVALVITAAVYGVVALIVKMDDVGLNLAQRSSTFAQKFGRGLVAAMPKVLSTLSAVGTVAMLWVGGHILLVGSDTLGWHAPYAVVHQGEEYVHDVEAVGSVLAWLVNTAASAVIGLVVGAVVLALVSVLPFGKKKEHASH
jgi:predicted DNA repair protein MutK